MTEQLKTTIDDSRTALRVEGPEALTFLQGLVTNDVAKAGPSVGVYAALLNPQGKLLADFIIWRPEETQFLIDVAAAFSADLQKRLTLYKLRAAVEIAPAPQYQIRLYWPERTAAPSQEGYGGPDPRDAALGWRYLASTDARADAAAHDASIEDWEQLRLSLGVPASARDLRANDAYPLEYGFERLNGVDFKKSCFVGQEIVARMKHKAELKKGLHRVAIEGPAPAPGADILSDGKPAGTLGSARDGVGLALLRFDRADGALTVGDAVISKAERI